MISSYIVDHNYEKTLLCPVERDINEWLWKLRISMSCDVIRLGIIKILYDDDDDVMQWWDWFEDNTHDADANDEVSKENIHTCYHQNILSTWFTSVV